jgi:hypothetical protein
MRIMPASPGLYATANPENLNSLFINGNLSRQGILPVTGSSSLPAIIPASLSPDPIARQGGKCAGAEKIGLLYNDECRTEILRFAE